MSKALEEREQRIWEQVYAMAFSRWACGSIGIFSPLQGAGIAAKEADSAIDMLRKIKSPYWSPT